MFTEEVSEVMHLIFVALSFNPRDERYVLKLQFLSESADLAEIFEQFRHTG